VDCLVGSDALEIKWRDATTDGDHITKEHTRMQAVRDAGYKPVRVMFYYPNREQAIRIPENIGKPLQERRRGISLRRCGVGIREAAHERGFARHPARPGRRKDGATWPVKFVMAIA
jgi:hypothetical protein